MKSFTDNTGRTWTLAVTVGTIKRVRALCDVDLANIITIDSGTTPKVDLLERLGSDPFCSWMCFTPQSSPKPTPRA